MLWACRLGGRIRGVRYVPGGLGGGLGVGLTKSADYDGETAEQGGEERVTWWWGVLGGVRSTGIPCTKDVQIAFVKTITCLLCKLLLSGKWSMLHHRLAIRAVKTRMLFPDMPEQVISPGTSITLLPRELATGNRTIEACAICGGLRVTRSAMAFEVFLRREAYDRTTRTGAAEWESVRQDVTTIAHVSIEVEADVVEKCT